LAVGYGGVNYLVEVKDGAKPASARKLTPDEERWHQGWLGRVHVVACEWDCEVMLQIEDQVHGD
jgi:hypothetical protein